MIDGLKILNAIDELVQEKNLDRDLVINALKEGIIKACERHIAAEAKIKVDFNQKTGALQVYRLWDLVDEVENSAFQMTKATAITNLETNKKATLTELVYQEPVNIENFSRLATTQVGQIFVQALKEAEREMLYEKYISKKGSILMGTVDNIEAGRFFLKISENTFAVLLKKDAIPFERLNVGDKVKFYVEDIKKNTGQIIASRVHSGFLEKLLEIEVPEIDEGLVIIKAISRIAGERSKVAVFCKDPTIDPIGACVGTKGQRIQNITKELNRERIDIIRWDEDIATFIINAVSPAKVISIKLDAENQEASIIVPDEHYSLAIGKRGMTAKLTAKLTEWKINIISYTTAQNEGLVFDWNGNLTLASLATLQENHRLRKANQNHNAEFTTKSSENDKPNVKEAASPTAEMVIDDAEAFFKDEDQDELDDEDFDEDDFSDDY